MGCRGSVPAQLKEKQALESYPMALGPWMRQGRFVGVGGKFFPVCMQKLIES